MSKFLIGLFVALGAGAWVYSKIQRRTGGNAQTSLLMAAMAGVIAFILTVIVFSLF
jgi:cytochrome bd-type quinol oxidase subunit 1